MVFLCFSECCHGNTCNLNVIAVLEFLSWGLCLLFAILLSSKFQNSIFSSPEPSGSQGELIVYPCSVVRPSVCRPSVRRPPFSKIFFSETAWPIKAKFYMKHLWEGGTNVYINNPGHMTKMAAMPIYGKKPFKNLLLRNHWTDFNQTWHEASMTQVLQCVYKS